MESIKQAQFQQRHQLEEQARQQRQRRQLELEVNAIYISALKHYRARNFDAAKEEFLRVNAKIPDYEFTRKYLGQLGVNLPPAPVEPSQPVGAVTMPPPVSALPPSESIVPPPQQVIASPEAISAVENQQKRA